MGYGRKKPKQADQQEIIVSRKLIQEEVAKFSDFYDTLFAVCRNQVEDLSMFRTYMKAMPRDTNEDKENYMAALNIAIQRGNQVGKGLADLTKQGFYVPQTFAETSDDRLIIQVEGT